MELDPREVWAVYVGDSNEAFQDIEESLLSLEADPTQVEYVNRLYRGMHTLKGNSGFLGLVNIEKLAHVAEDLVGLVRDRGVPLDGEITDVLLETLDALRAGVQRAADRMGDIDPLTDLVTKVKGLHKARERGEGPAAAAPPPAPEPLFAQSAPAEIEALESEPPEEPVDMVDPSTDPMYLEIFLSIARDRMQEVSGGLAQLQILGLTSPEGMTDPATIAGYVDEFRHAADRMGYVPLCDVLSRLSEALGALHRDNYALAVLERETYAALVMIEENYAAIAPSPSDFGFISLYRRSCADHVFASLARLRNLVDDTETGQSREDTEIPSLFRELRASCDYYGFAGGSRSCLDQEDLYSRTLDAHEPLASDLVERTKEFIRRLGEAVEAVNRGEDCEDVAGVEAPDDPMKYASEAAEYGFSPELQLVITRTNLGTASDLLRQGKSLYEIRADLDGDDALCGTFWELMSSGEVESINSATVFAGDHTQFDFLVASALSADAMESALRRLEPAGARLRLRVPSKDSPPTPLAVASLAPPPEPVVIAEPEVVAAPAPAPHVSNGVAAAPKAQAPGKAEPEHEVAEPEKEEAAPARVAQSGNGPEFLRIDSRKISLIMDLAGEIGLASGAVTHHPEVRRLELEGFSTAAHKLEMLIRELQNEVSSMRLVPIAGVFQRMKRVVRDTAKRTGKLVDLVLQGEDTEIDKYMVDSLHDPLVHMLRNAIDHGLETPEERRAAGKPETGKLVLEASHEAGEVSITLSDDGRGIDRERVLARGLERGLVQPGQRLSEAELLGLIFEPGFSTKEQVSELSGRGVGMDVVKTTVEALRGRCSIRSSQGKGTRFLMRMPLTLAFIEAMVVEQKKRLFVLPIEKVFEVFKAEEHRLVKSSVENRVLVRVREDFVPVCWVHRFYGETSPDERAPGIEDVVDKIVVVVQTGTGKLALAVDDLLGNQQVMLKPLRGVLGRIRASAGCGMLSSGDVAVALDCERLHA
jgi:two-component system chemotaxis sensor kinase CheA